MFFHCWLAALKWENPLVNHDVMVCRAFINEDCVDESQAGALKGKIGDTPRAVENDRAKILWDCQIQTD